MSITKYTRTLFIVGGVACTNEVDAINLLSDNDLPLNCPVTRAAVAFQDAAWSPIEAPPKAGGCHGLLTRFPWEQK